MRELTAGLLRKLKSLHGDASGAVLVYFAASMPAIIGVSMLAVDVGRYSALQSSLQHGADALALAGAAELDLRSDALSRANRAVDNLITTNKSLFSNSSITINGGAVTRCYLQTLPASDTTALSSGNCLNAGLAASNSKAAFLRVRVSNVNFTTVFPLTFLGALTNNYTESASAVAGFQAAVCKFTPMFMCNPFEPTSGVTDALTDYGLYNAVTTVAFRRRIIKMKGHSNNDQWAPGNYGFLQPTTGPGAHTLGESIADVVPQACFVLKGLQTQTGNITSLSKAFNTRFDMYDGSFSKLTYPPSVNVRKGYIVKKATGNGTANSCNDNNRIETWNAKTPASTYNDAMGFPPDSVISASRLGNGDWGGDTASTSKTITDFKQYWLTNHSGKPYPTDANGTAYSNTNLPTRYDIYRYEIANGLVSQPSSGYTGVKETGSPVCNAGAGIDNPDRRIIYAAILNCRAVGMSGGQGGPYQSMAFGKFFMTAPMGEPSDSSTLFTELVDVVRPGRADSVARDIVQLFR